jgi:hypothetical protein
MTDLIAVAGDLENAMREALDVDGCDAPLAFEVGLAAGKLYQAAAASDRVDSNDDVARLRAASDQIIEAMHDDNRALRKQVGAGIEQIEALKRQLTHATEEVASYASVVDPWTDLDLAVPRPNDWNDLLDERRELLGDLAAFQQGIEEEPAAQETRPAPPQASGTDHDDVELAGAVRCPSCSRQVKLSRWGKISWHNTPDKRSCRGAGTQIVDRTPDVTVAPQIPRGPGAELSERIARLDAPASDNGCTHTAVTDGIPDPCTFDDGHDGGHSWEQRRQKLETAAHPRNPLSSRGGLSTEELAAVGGS